jgi:hypothetical protein
MLISIHGDNGLAIAGCMSAKKSLIAATRKAEIELVQWIGHFIGGRRVPAKLTENCRWYYREGESSGTRRRSLRRPGG